MNCRSFRLILDNHEFGRLTAARRGDVDAHLAACEACANVWTAHEALVSESFAGPTEQFFAAVMNSMQPLHRPEKPIANPFLWRTAAGTVAVALVIGLALLLSTPQNDRTTPEAISVPAIVDAVEEGESASRFVAGRDYVRLNAGVFASASPKLVEGEVNKMALSPGAVPDVTKVE